MPDWYEGNNVPAPEVVALSSTQRNEYDEISQSFVKFPPLGLQWANYIVRISADGSILTLISREDLAALFTAATTTVQGVLKLATQAEVDAGTNNTKAVTPLTRHEKPLEIITDSTTARTIAAGDKNALILFTNASAVAVTISLDATTDLGDGFIVHLCQYGAGQVRVIGETNAVDIQASKSAFTKNQYSVLSVIKTGDDQIRIVGGQDG